MEPKFYKVIDADNVEDNPMYVIGVGGADADKTGDDLEKVIRNMMLETKKKVLPPNLLLEEVSHEEAMTFVSRQVKKDGGKIAACPVCYHAAGSDSSTRDAIKGLIDKGVDMEVTLCPNHAKDAKEHQSVHAFTMRGHPGDVGDAADFLGRIAGYDEIPDVLLTLISGVEMRDRSMICVTPEGHEFFEKGAMIYDKCVTKRMEEDKSYEIGDLYCFFADATAEIQKLREKYQEADLAHSDAPVSSTLQ